MTYKLDYISSMCELLEAEIRFLKMEMLFTLESDSNHPDNLKDLEFKLEELAALDCKLETLKKYF